MKPNHIKTDTRLQWLGSGRKIGSQTFKQALNLARKAFINSLKPLCEQIGYQTLIHRSHPTFFIRKRSVMIRTWTKHLTIYRSRLYHKAKSHYIVIGETKSYNIWYKTLTLTLTLIQAENLDPKRSSKPLTLPKRHSSILISQLCKLIDYIHPRISTALCMKKRITLWSGFEHQTLLLKDQKLTTKP